MPNKKLPRCKCGYLEREGNDPDSPIKFDERTNEFYFAYQTESSKDARLCIYHCPFCGGRAPDSIRHTLFHIVPDSETRRLTLLTQNLRTVQKVLAALGTPEYDFPAGLGVTTPERDSKPEKTEFCRTLRYENLSETASVEVIVYGNDGVSFCFQGKSKSPAKPA